MNQPRISFGKQGPYNVMEVIHQFTGFQREASKIGHSVTIEFSEEVAVINIYMPNIPKADDLKVYAPLAKEFNTGWIAYSANLIDRLDIADAFRGIVQ